MIINYPSQGSFLDPTLTKDKKPYGPARYKEIVQERYFISKNINTSYNDIGKITPAEREYLIEFIVDEQKQTKKKLDEMKQQRNSR